MLHPNDAAAFYGMVVFRLGICMNGWAHGIMNLLV
jgi:hypothetical protein